MKPKYHKTAAQLASMIYEGDQGQLRSLLRLHGFHGEQAWIQDSAVLDERVLMVTDGLAVYVVWRGTVNGAQWRSDMDVRSIDGAHRGFHAGLEALFPAVLEECEVVARSGKPLIFCGHSRGAAEALLAARVLEAAGVSPVEVHLFGCPRALKKPQARAFDATLGGVVWRWVANNDAVTRFPCEWMGFRHVGREMYFDALGRLTRGGFWRRLRGQFRGRVRGGLLDGIRDHSAAREYARLVGDLL